MKKTVLIVDDDASVRDSLKALLESTGYAIILAGDGREALVRLKQKGIDLLLLDLNLPKLSGFDLLDIATERCPLMPVIILTAFAGQCEPGALAGADTFMEKPPDVNFLLESVHRLLSEPAEERIQRLLAGSARVSPAGMGVRGPHAVPAEQVPEPPAVKKVQA